MKNFYVLTDALEYIENNICENIDSQAVADFCRVSLSSLQKLFRLALNKSVKDYILRRRISLAARDIQQTDMKMIDIAYKYQFGSPESFVRAFRKVWNETPTSYKKTWKFSGIYPKLDYQYEEGADEEMAAKRVDISEAYDEICRRRGSYVICFDIVGLIPINDISREAGDFAILECARRIDQVCTGEMMQLRIGGDEFALITGSKDWDYVKGLEDDVLKHNMEPIEWKGTPIPLSLRAGIIKVPEGLRYSEFFTEMHEAINTTRKKEKQNKLQ